MDFHISALFRRDVSGRILISNETDGERAPRLFLGRTTAGNLWRFRDDLPPDLVRELEAILAQEPIADDLRQPPAYLSDVCQLLSNHAPNVSIDQGPAWYFPDQIVLPRGVVAIPPAPREHLQEHFSFLAEDLENCQPCRAV